MVESIPTLPPGMQLFLVLGAGFLAAQVFAHVLRRRIPIYGSALYLLLGVLAGPLMLGVVGIDTLEAARIPITLAVGWVALEVGLGLTLREDGGLSDGALRTGVVHGLVTLTLFGGVALFLALYVMPELFVGSSPAVAAAALACAGLSGSPFVVRFVAARLGAKGPVKEAGESLVRVARVVALLAFGITLAFLDRASITGFRALAPAEWVLAELLGGLAIGLTVDAFLGEDPDDRRLVVSLMGVTLVTTGVGLHLGLSPIVLNLAVGLTLANFGRRSASRHQAATSLEQPTLAVFLVVGGASVTSPVGWNLAALAVAFVMFRILAVGFAGAVAARALDPDSMVLRRLGLIGVGQGAPAVAIALTYSQATPASTLDTVLVVILASVVLNDLWATPAARVVLDEAGEIPTLAPEG